MKAASQSGIKVLLDGQGGDEVFMGYERYFVAHIRQLFRQLSWGAAFFGSPLNGAQQRHHGFVHLSEVSGLFQPCWHPQAAYFAAQLVPS